MASVRAESWTVDANGLYRRRRGRPDVGLGDSFVLGLTQPTAFRGLLGSTGPRVADAQLTSYAGSFTNVKSGDVIDRLAITGRFYPNAVENVQIRDSLILMGSNPAGPSTGTKAAGNFVDNSWYGIRGTGLVKKGLLAEFCEIRPSVSTVDTYGVSGRNWDLYRCKITGVVDGFSPSGLSSDSSANQFFAVRGCYVEVLSYSSDPRQSNGSHSDGIQAQGHMLGNSPWSVSAQYPQGLQGAVGNTIKGGATSCILIQQQTGTGKYGKLLIDSNWFYGDPTKGMAVGISGGDPLIPDVWIRWNRFAQSSRPEPYRLLISNPNYDAPDVATRIHSNVELETGLPVKMSKGG